MKEYFVYIIPRPGLMVRFPKTKAVLPEDGSMVPYTGSDGTYWKRRIRCGDVIMIDKPKDVKKAIKIEKQKEKESRDEMLDEDNF